MNEREEGRDFEAIVHHHHNDVWWYARSLGCDHDSANDLTQAAFVALYQNEAFVDESPAQTFSYLRTCVLNELRSRLRKDRRLQIGLPEGFEASDEALEGLLIRRDLIWQEMHDDADLRRDALRLCMEELSGQRAQAIDLRYTRGLKHREVADTMQLEATTLTKLLQRTRAALRRCIEARIRKGVSGTTTGAKTR